MELPTEPVRPSPQVVGNAFLQQYYAILHESPESFYRFYQDSSILSRSDSNGVMKSVTTTKAINEFILSLDCKDCITEILSADSQQSCKDGVFILVTGCLIGLDKVRKRFSQSFFLAPQDGGGYFVLNDVFRFVNDSQQNEANQMLASGVSDVHIAPLTPEQDVVAVQDLRATDPLTPLSEEFCNDGEKSHDVAENGGSVVKEQVSLEQPVQPSHIDTEVVPETIPPVVQEDLPKKSYAAILVKGSSSLMPRNALNTTMARPSTKKLEKLLLPSTTLAQAPETTASSSNSTCDTNDLHKEGHSVFIRNLPLDATAPQVEEIFKKFGPIKPQGVQVRNHKTGRGCFGFVEFESLDSLQAAIKASQVMIGGRRAFIEEKRTMARVNGVVSGGNNGSANSGRGRYSVSRGSGNGGGFHNDNFRGGRGSFGGFARNEFRNIRGGGDFPGRGRGPQRGRTGEAYGPRTVQNGSAGQDVQTATAA